MVHTCRQPTHIVPTRQCFSLAQPLSSNIHTLLAACYSQEMSTLQPAQRPLCTSTCRSPSAVDSPQPVEAARCLMFLCREQTVHVSQHITPCAQQRLLAGWCQSRLPAGCTVLRWAPARGGGTAAPACRCWATTHQHPAAHSTARHDTAQPHQVTCRYEHMTNKGLHPHASVLYSKRARWCMLPPPCK